MFSDTSTDIEIKECIEARQSFSVVAGAGSGKTRSLIKALFFVRKTKGVTLNTNAQKVVCITYTNSAVDVIQRRLDQDPLFKVSTIHSFIWGEIARFQSEIRSQLAVKLLPQRIEKKQEEDNGGNSRTAINARKRVARLQTALDNLNSVECFVYDEKGGRNYSEGRLDHDDIIDLGTLMILNLPILRKILGQKYPFIFIDESQDTFPQIVEALNEISNSEKLPVIGYFGDPMQQIYENRAGEINGPTNSKVIKKEENYRCSEAVIKLLNSFRKDIQQKPAGNNAEGSVELLLIKAEPGEGPRKSYTDKQIGAALLKFDKALDDFGWSDDNEVKRLFLTRQMIANRLNFKNLNSLFSGNYASRSVHDDFEDGSHFILKPFLDVLIPLKKSIDTNDEHHKLNILREHSPLLDSEGKNASKTLREVAEIFNKACDELNNAWYTSTTKHILSLALDHQIISDSDRLNDHLKREPRSEEYDPDNEEHVKDKGDWLLDEFFKFDMTELGAYREFVLGETPFSTQHGVKGDEFKKVLVIYDDTEASWHLYNFLRLLTPKTAGKEPTDGQRTRGSNLAYVCFSRAIEDLKIILFTPNPETSKNELIEAKLFTEDQISINS